MYLLLTFSADLVVGGLKKWFDSICRVDRDERWRGATKVFCNWTVPLPYTGAYLCDFCLCSWNSRFRREGKVILEVEFSRRVTGEKQPLWKALGRAGTEVIRAVQLEQDKDVAAKGAKQCT